MKNKKKPRSQVKNPYLKKGYNSKIRQEYIDHDYLDKLSEEELSFLNKFDGEFYAADLDFKNLDNNFHNTQELKKECTDSNNARNRDMLGRAKAANRINDTNNYTDEKEVINIEVTSDKEDSSDPDIERILVEYIDSKRKD